MPWPFGQDYNEAIQTPRIVFEDADLKSATAECDKLGIPRPRTGNFATVYKMHCGQRIWAVKCFTRELKDQKERYVAVRDHLVKVHLPYTVDFNFLERGIKVGGRWYAVLKMEWVEGDTLDGYVRKNLNNSTLLLSLAARWVEMLQALQGASIAHGDLQHGNVLILNSGIKLVDYDGMYVPALAGKGSSEIGQPNYQHPHRSGRHFGLYLDNFSGWVIYLSLVSLALSPGLWQRFNRGDDTCLLFRKRDFEEPDKSTLLKEVEKIPNPHLRDLTEFFRMALYSPPESVPGLNGQFPTPVPVRPTPLIPGWLEDHISSESAKDSPKLEVTAPSSDPSWVLDFITPPEFPIQLGNSMMVERLFAVGFFLACLLLLQLGVSPWTVFVCVLTVMPLNVLGLIRRYRADPAVAQLLELQTEIRSLESEIRQANADRAGLEKERTAVKKGEADSVAQISKQLQTVASDENRDKAQVEKQLRQTLTPLLKAKQLVDEGEMTGLQNLQNGLGRKVAELTKKLGSLAQAESDELASSLRSKQEQFLNAYLKSSWLENARIPGIGVGFRQRLMIAGYLTAADIDQYRVMSVPGIGSTRAGALWAWRQGVEAEGRMRMPVSIGAAEELAIRSKYAAARISTEAEQNKNQQELTLQEHQVRTFHAAQRSPLEEKISRAHAESQAEVGKITSGYTVRKDSINAAKLKIHERVSRSMSDLQEKADQQQQVSMKLQWERAKLRNRKRRFAAVSFPRYLRRALVGR